jgi:hypothetical protein
MGRPFSDITLYLPTPFVVGTPEYYKETSLKNYVSDLYFRHMNGYKPPKVTRITIQPHYHEIWNRTWKHGSIVSIAPHFDYNKYEGLEKQGKYLYLLDLIQNSVLQLSKEYGWDKLVFEKAYNEVIENNFIFNINMPSKLSRDKKRVANLSIEKTETVTSVYANIQEADSIFKAKLFDKANVFWYDCAYILAKHNKWFDADRFGINYGKGQINIWYSIKKNEVELFENDTRVTEIDFRKFFLFG